MATHPAVAPSEEREWAAGKGATVGLVPRLHRIEETFWDLAYF